jgi:DNA-binding protein HU-beta
LNKHKLTVVVGNALELSYASAAEVIDATIEAISGALKKGDDVRLVGFGTFEVSERAASKGRNPRTGEEISIPAVNSAKFRPGKKLKDDLNG